MKLRVARTVKWNIIDKFLSMILYTVTGIILARVVPNDDFGLIGAALVFSAFAALFIDSGFSSALIQKKNVSRLDYSSVLWFNIAISVIIYIILFFGAPLIAKFYQNDLRIIPVARVLFLTFILNAIGIVQANRLVKQMNVKMIAVANSLSLFISSVVAIWMAINGYGVWALVWQAVLQAGIKSLVLWLTGEWLPVFKVSFQSLRSFFHVGIGMMGGSFLNILFKNIYAFIIGNRAGMLSLSYYTQADKWSNMGISSLAAVFTQSFLPALSEYQDSPKDFASSTAKMNRCASYLVFPFCGLLIVATPAIFHFLFGTKWDDSIVLFQLLMFRGVFTVLSSQYNNYILALGKSRLIVITEMIRDIAALIGIAVTWTYIAMEKPDNLIYGITILLWGQIAASFLTWGITLVITARLSWRKWWQFIADSAPYAVITLVSMGVMIIFPGFIQQSLPLLLSQLIAGIVTYIGLNMLFGSKIQKDVFGYVLNRFKT